MNDDKHSEPSVTSEGEEAKVDSLHQTDKESGDHQIDEPMTKEDMKDTPEVTGENDGESDDEAAVAKEEESKGNEQVDQAASNDKVIAEDQKPIQEVEADQSSEAADSDQGLDSESGQDEKATESVDTASADKETAADHPKTADDQVSADQSEPIASPPSDESIEKEADDQKAEADAKEPAEQPQPLTIEEKRKQQREKKMTIEEKRQRQQDQAKEPAAPFSLHTFWTQRNRWDRFCLAILALCGGMNIYISIQVMRYAQPLYAALVFFAVIALILLVLWLMIKYRRIGYAGCGILTLLLVIGCFGAYRLSRFSNQVFNNVETETVMIVAKKDSPLTPQSDFNRRKLALVEYDEALNEFAKTILKEEKKSGVVEVPYASYQKAYEDMQAGKVDMMVYNAQIQKSFEEAKIDSAAHIKVLFKKQFKQEAVKSKQVDITKDPFNVYISGVDLTSNSINEKGSSDVNIILTVNPQTKKMIMQTIPRDSWAPLTCMNGRHTKLTYAGSYGGIDCSIQTIEKMYGITINYYAKINFQGVIDLVDALGGITVNSDVAFCEEHPFEGYGVRNYCYAAGANQVDGIEALMFSRIRRVFSEGDIERGRHQMALVEGVMNKFMQEPTMAHINGLLGAVESNFTTNLSENDMVKALQLFLRVQDQIDTIETYTMEGELIWNDDEISQEYLYYFYPHDGEIAAFQQRVRDVMAGK